MSTLESAIRILQALTPDRPVLGVSDLSTHLDLPKSTVSRLLKTLNDGGLLHRDDATRKYTAGPLTLQLGGLYLAHNSLLELVDKAVGNLVEEFGFTGYVGLLDGNDVLIVRQWVGRYPLRYVLDVGTRVRTSETAIGLALLATFEEEAVHDLIRADGPNTEVADIRKMVADTRRQGWIEYPCEAVPGITAIGCAISSETSVGLSLSFPDAAADGNLRREMTTRILSVTAQIEGLLQAPLRLGNARSV